MKVIVFSRTGQRATPFLRQAAKNYWAHASFAFVLWQEEDSSVWWNTYVDILSFYSCSMRSWKFIMLFYFPRMSLSGWVLIWEPKPTSFIPTIWDCLNGSKYEPSRFEIILWWVLHLMSRQKFDSKSLGGQLVVGEGPAVNVGWDHCWIGKPALFSSITIP